MIRTLDLSGGRMPTADMLARRPASAKGVDEAVREIIDQVADGGEAAVLDLGERLDGIRPPSLRVPTDVIDRALAELDPELRAALELVIARLEPAHRAQLPRAARTEVAPGATVSQRWEPVERVGLYVPGGRASYPSSVIMNALPAQLAGVGSIALASPPRRDAGGWPSTPVLAAASLLGLDEVYAVGGAQAIAMLALGTLGSTSDCRPVRLITGPGNAYVAAAKRALAGQVGIDSEAGPTEVVIIADGGADAKIVALDLISQAEHDPQAAAVLVTDSRPLAAAVALELGRQVGVTQHRDRVAQALSGPQSAIVIVDDLDHAVAVANGFAAEHLEIQTADPGHIAARVRNAGAIFVGRSSPVPLGDYLAGSNHVLPTSGTAAFSAALSVMTFLRSVQVVEYSPMALAEVAAALDVLAAAEGLPAHGAAVRARLTEQ